MKYELIGIDIDGTLLNDEKKLLPQVRDTIQEAAKRGSKIVLISGRMPAGVNLVEKELGVPCIKVCNAGSYILLGDECISTTYLLPDIMRYLYREIARKNNVPLWIFHEKKWFVTEIDRYIEKEIQIIQYQPEVIDVETVAKRWEKEGKGPNKLLIAAEPNKIKNIYQQIQKKQISGIDIACSANTLLEIFPKGVNKGNALITICNKLNIDIKNTVAFGDHELDIPMIEVAGVGIAMGNAIEELKAKADFVTKSNNEAGIAYAFEHYLVK